MNDAITRMFYKDALSISEIVVNLNLSASEVVGALREHKDGKTKKVFFGPRFHDRVVDFLKANPTEKNIVNLISEHFFIPKATAYGILNGKNYKGAKYTSEELRAEWKTYRGYSSDTAASEKYQQQLMDLYRSVQMLFRDAGLDI